LELAATEAVVCAQSLTEAKLTSEATQLDQSLTDSTRDLQRLFAKMQLASQ
jgi:hypothetical protein